MEQDVAPLTIESLAVALHVTAMEASHNRGLGDLSSPTGHVLQDAPWNETPAEYRAWRVEQARLLFERIMR